MKEIQMKECIELFTLHYCTVKKGCKQFTYHCCGFFFILDQMKTSETNKKEKMGVFKVLEESPGSNAECVF